jgi:hypothetical protein
MTAVLTATSSTLLQSGTIQRTSDTHVAPSDRRLPASVNRRVTRTSNIWLCPGRQTSGPIERFLHAGTERGAVDPVQLDHPVPGATSLPLCQPILPPVSARWVAADKV